MFVSRWNCDGQRLHAVLTIVRCLLVLVGIWPESCHGDSVCTAKPLSWNSQAGARFGLSINLREADGSNCGLTDEESLQMYLAAQWVTDRLNRDNGQGSYVPGVKIGFDLLDDCNSLTRAVHQALDFADCRDSYNTSSDLRLGLIGPERSSSAEATVNAMRNIPVPIISPSATLASLTDEDNAHSTFFRTVPSDRVQIAAIVAILKQLGWTYIAVIHSNDNYGTMGRSILLQLAARENICINASFAVTDAANIFDSIIDRLLTIQGTAKGQSLGVVFIGHYEAAKTLILSLRRLNVYGVHFIMSDSVNTNPVVFDSGGNIAIGSLTLAPSSIVLQDFEDNLNDKFKGVKNGSYSDLPVNVYLQENSYPLGRIKQTPYVPPVVSAIFVLAEATKRAHAEMCNGVPGICEQLVTKVAEGVILKHMKNISVNFGTMDAAFAPREFKDINYVLQFDGNNDIVPKPFVPDYVIYAYNGGVTNKFINIGNYSGGQLAMNLSQVRMSTAYGSIVSQVQSSVCSGNCEMCASNGYIPLAHLPGSAYIIGIFSMHSLQSSKPLTCGAFRNTSFDTATLEAFLHSVEQLRETTGIDFGAIAFDDCYSPLRLTTLLSNYLSGSVSCKNVFKVCVPQEKVFGVIGARASGSSLQAAGFFTPLRVPVISYSSSSPDLDDKSNYPYFLRTVVSDTEQAKAMAELVQTMGWKYVGLLYINNNYGIKGANAFQNAARERGFCVAAKVTIPENPTLDDEGDMLDAFSTLVQQQVKVVVFFGVDVSILAFLQVVETKYTGRFIFIGSENWGTNAFMVNAAKRSTRGSITFKVDNINLDPAQEESFRTRLLKRTPGHDDVNPWFTEFWQNFFSCNIPGGFNNVFAKECNGSLRFSAAQVTSLLEVEHVRHVMNAVSALGKGIAGVREEAICEERFPCDNLRAVKNVIKVYDSIRTQKGAGQSAGEALFDENGNGNLGFTIYSIQGDNNVYKPVGYYTRQRGLSLQKDQILFYTDSGKVLQDWTAECLDTLCVHCGTVVVPNATEKSTGTEVHSDAPVIIGSILPVMCVGFLVTIILGYIYIKRRTPKWKPEPPQYDEPSSLDSQTQPRPERSRPSSFDSQTQTRPERSRPPSFDSPSQPRPERSRPPSFDSQSQPLTERSKPYGTNLAFDPSLGVESENESNMSDGHTDSRFIKKLSNTGVVSGQENISVEIHTYNGTDLAVNCPASDVTL